MRLSSLCPYGVVALWGTGEGQKKEKREGKGRNRHHEIQKKKKSQKSSISEPKNEAGGPGEMVGGGNNSEQQIHGCGVEG